MDLDVVNDGIPHGIGHFRTLHLPDFFVHCLLIQRSILIRNKINCRRNSLRNGLGRNHNQLLVFRDRGSLIRCQNDVLVVRKNEHRICVHLLHSIQNVLRARIHRLSAGNDIIHAKTTENVRKSFAGAHCNHADVLLRLIFRRSFFERLLRSGGLLFLRSSRCKLFKFLSAAKVDNGNLLQLSVQKSSLKNQSRIVGMHLNMHAVIRTNGHDLICNRIHVRRYIAVNLVIVGLRKDLKEGHDIAVFKICILRIFLFSGLFLRRRIEQCFHIKLCSLVALIGALEKLQKSLSAGVHYSSLLQNRKHLRSLRKNLTGILHNLRDKFIKIRNSRICQLSCLLGSALCNRKDGSFLRLHDCFICGLDRLVKSICAKRNIDFLRIADDLAEAAEKLGKNDTGITAGSAKRAGRNGLADLLHVIGILNLQNLTNCRYHCHSHIRSGISIRYREYVQFINPGFI